jgi:hypothetical protein
MSGGVMCHPLQLIDRLEALLVKYHTANNHFELSSLYRCYIAYVIKFSFQRMFGKCTVVVSSLNS